VPEEGSRKPAPPPLPPVADLRPVDFTPFMNAHVDPATRRSALKKLFTDGHFNEPDLFEPYSADFTQGEPIPAKMLRAINRVRDVALKGPEKVAEEERLAAEADKAEPAKQADNTERTVQEPEDVLGKQDA
jgi:hypothetical protein